MSQKDPENKDILDPSFNFSDFLIQTTGGRLRWLATIIGMISIGFFVYLICTDKSGAIYFPFHIEGDAAFWMIGIATIVWVALAIINWIAWFRKRNNIPQ